MVKLLLSAFLVSAAFAPIGIWYLAIIGFALFFRALSKSSRPIFFSFIFGLLANGIILHWSSKYVGALPWIALSLLQSLFTLPVGWIYSKTGSVRWAILTLLAMEELRTRFPFGGFGWTRIAFSQVDSPFAPLVRFGGVLLLSLVTLLLSSLLIRISVRQVFLFLFLLLFSNLLPMYSVPEKTIALLAIQGNTPNVGLEFNDRAKAVFELHRDATRKYATGSYDAIVWPENAIDIDPQKYPTVARDIAALIAELKTPIIAGVVLNRGVGPQNASIKYGIDAKEESLYIKRYLTPFGEYMPLRSLAEIISPYASSVQDFEPGTKLVTHQIAGQQIAPIICYEIINDGIVRTAAKNSVAFIVQTNSATFAGTPESAQQLAITRLRAIEHSRSVLSVSTVGISALIDNNGRVLKATSENVATSMEVKLPITKNITMADWLGGLAPILVLLITFFWALPTRFIELKKT